VKRENNSTSDGASQSEVKYQAYKAAKLSGCLNDTIWRNKYLRQETKVRIYKSVIRPDLTYAAGTCADTSKTKHILETTEMNTSGKRVGKARLDRVRNQDIRSSQYENWYIEEGRIK